MGDFYTDALTFFMENGIQLNSEQIAALQEKAKLIEDAKKAEKLAYKDNKKFDKLTNSAEKHNEKAAELVDAAGKSAENLKVLKAANQAVKAGREAVKAAKNEVKKDKIQGKESTIASKLLDIKD